MMRRGDFMQTASGRQFWPLDPRPEEVFIEDIAHALAHQCRYGGHSTLFYTVAEHCLHVARAVSDENKLWGLLHDASEAYVQDVIRPVKRSLVGYAEIEIGIHLAVAARFGLSVNSSHVYPLEVKVADNRILVDEHIQCMAPGVEWETDSLEPLGVVIEFASPQAAKIQYLDMFHDLTGGAYV